MNATKSINTPTDRHLIPKPHLIPPPPITTPQQTLGRGAAENRNFEHESNCDVIAMLGTVDTIVGDVRSGLECMGEVELPSRRDSGTWLYQDRYDRGRSVKDFACGAWLVLGMQKTIGLVGV